MKGTAKRKPAKKKSAEEGHYHLRLPDDLNDWTRQYAVTGGFQNEVDVMRHALRELRARVGQGQSAEAQAA